MLTASPQERFPCLGVLTAQSAQKEHGENMSARAQALALPRTRLEFLDNRKLQDSGEGQRLVLGRG